MNKKSYTWRYLTEAPTGEGPNFNTDIPKSDIKPAEYKDFYLGKKAPAESDKQDTVANIVVKVKEFLLSQPNKIYPHDYKAFRDELIRIIKEVVPNLGNSDAGYCSRKIQDYLFDTGIIVDERGGLKLEKPIKTIEVVKAITPNIEASLNGETIDDDEGDEPEEEVDDIDVKPPFDVNKKYEKYGDEFDEASLSEEESDALDTITDGETGSSIIQKIQAKRAFRGKSIEEIHGVINSLIKKHALEPAGGYGFDVKADDLPAFSEFKRQNKTLGDSYTMKFIENDMIMEAYLNKRQQLIDEGLGQVASNLGNRFMAQLPTFAPQAAAQAKGNVQANQQQNQLYKAFLQNLGQAGYNQKTVPGNYLVGWMAQNFDQNIANLPEAQNLNVNTAVADTQKAFNQILQAYNRTQITGNVAAPQQQQPTQQTAQPKTAGKPQPAGAKQPQGYGIPPAEYQNLMNTLAANPNWTQRERTKAVNAFLRRNGLVKAPTQNTGQPGTPATP